MAKFEGDQSVASGRLALEDDARLLITAGRFEHISHFLDCHQFLPTC